MLKESVMVFLLISGQLSTNKNVEEISTSRVGIATLITARSSRPLLQISTILEQRFGVIVNYADPSFDSSTDVIDATAPEWRAKHPNERGLLVPKIQVLSSSIPDSANTLVDALKILEISTDALNQQNGTYTFNVRVNGGTLTLVGQSRLQRASVFDGVIMGTPMAMTGDQELKRIIGACAKASNTEIVLGQAPLNLLSQVQVQKQSSSISCLEELQFLFAKISAKVSVVLTFDPNSQSYVMSILPVYKQVLNGNGKISVELQRH